MKIFTTGQVAKICKVAPRIVSKWYDSGRLKGYRIPGSQERRIPREYLLKFLEEHGMPIDDVPPESEAAVDVQTDPAHEVRAAELEHEVTEPTKRAESDHFADVGKMVVELRRQSLEAHMRGDLNAADRLAALIGDKLPSTFEKEDLQPQHEEGGE